MWYLANPASLVTIPHTVLARQHTQATNSCANVCSVDSFPKISQGAIDLTVSSFHEPFAEEERERLLV